jgi:putative SOS response-associated peptidase YedK
MCGRIFVKSSAANLVSKFGFAHAGNALSFDKRLPTFNGAPRQELPIIIREPDYAGGMFVLARWGLIPGWIREANPKFQPINARCEEVASKGMFRSTYRTRRALLPIDGFFEWKAVIGAKAKQPYAIAMKSGEPFALAALWEMWRQAGMGVELRTFCVITCPANELVANIHDRMPVILGPQDYARWISEEPDPRDLMKPFPSDLMTMWPISTRVNKPENNDADLLTPIAT